MRTHLIALAATLSIAGIAAASAAGVTAPSGGGSSGGTVSSGGGGGHAGGGGFGGGHMSSGGGGHFGGGGIAGARFSGAHFGGANLAGRTGGYTGHAVGGSHTNFMAHGGYIAHGGRGYRLVGYESAGLSRTGAMPRGIQAPRISPASFGPRRGSAATAKRMGNLHLARLNTMRPRTGHPHRPGPKRPYLHLRRADTHLGEYPQNPPMFCTFEWKSKDATANPGCLEPVKGAVSARKR